MNALYSYTIETTPEEFDFVKTVTAGQSFRWVETSPNAWRGADGGNCYDLRVAPGRLEIQSNAPQEAFGRLFRLQDSLVKITEDIQSLCPELGMTIEAARGLRLMHHQCKREVVFSFLCSSLNNIPRIQSMVRHLASLAKGVDAGGSFPELEVLANTEEQSLRACGFGYRAAFVPQVARQLLERGGESHLELLGTLSYAEAHRELMQLRGVGRKVADCVLLLGYGMDEAFPIDTHVLQAVARHHQPEWLKGSLTDRKYQEIGKFYREKFGKYAGYAQHLLFFENRNRIKQ